MTGMYCVLFVSKSNVCRSAIAEAVFRQLVTEEGLAHRIGADSVGMDGGHAGEMPEKQAIDAADRHGYTMRDLRARCLMKQDFYDFDLILAMDQEHYQALLRQAPDRRRGQVAMFLDAAPQYSRTDVPEPRRDSPRDYDFALAMIEIGARAWLERIRGEAL